MIVSEPSDPNIRLLPAEATCADEFKEIYQLYWKRIFGLAYYRLRSTHLAENIVQDVFTSFWMRQCNKDNAPVRDIYAWLAAATKYAILKQIAILQKWQMQTLDEKDSIPIMASVDLLFVDEMLATEINRLPQKCKLVFRYSREENLHNKEIARQLHVSEKTVEKHISTALRKLRLRLKGFMG